MKVAFLLIADYRNRAVCLVGLRDAITSHHAHRQPPPMQTRAQLLTGIPQTATAVPAPTDPATGVTRTQVVPPMESLSRFTVGCLEERLPTLEAGDMFTPILKALVDCLTPQELAATRRYVPP